MPSLSSSLCARVLSWWQENTGFSRARATRHTRSHCNLCCSRVGFVRQSWFCASLSRVVSVVTSATTRMRTILGLFFSKSVAPAHSWVPIVRRVSASVLGEYVVIQAVFLAERASGRTRGILWVSGDVSLHADDLMKVLNRVRALKHRHCVFFREHHEERRRYPQVFSAPKSRCQVALPTFLSHDFSERTRCVVWLVSLVWSSLRRWLEFALRSAESSVKEKSHELPEGSVVTVVSGSRSAPTRSWCGFSAWRF